MADEEIQGRSVRSQADTLPADYAGHPDYRHFAGSTGLLFDQAMAQTRMAIILSDPRQPDNPIVFANEAFSLLTGYPPDEIIGRNCRFLQGPKSSPHAVDKMREAIRTEKVAVIEILNYRKDGTEFWNALHLGPIYDEAGELLYFFGSQWDVSNIHQARSEERHARAMAREVSHRLKNVFAVIGGIVNITGRAMNALEVSRKINERIQALGRSYEPTLDEAFMGEIEIGQAIRAVLRPYDPEGGRIRFSGNGVRSEPNAVSVVGLTLHELAVNATKYGALSNEAGTIDVGWSARESDGATVLVIDWQENGGPPIEAEPPGKGTGFNIARSLLAHAKGSLETQWPRAGLHAVLHMPLKT